MRDKLFETIDSLYSEYIGFWADVCNIESPTSHKAGVDAVSSYFAEKAKMKGWRVDVLPQDVAGDFVTITMNPNVTERPISLSGHIDTVHPLGSFGSPAVRFDDKKIYGPGVTDCKGGIVAAFMAMDALDRCGFRARPIQLLLQVDEEHCLTNKYSIKYIAEQAKDAVAFFNLEGNSPGEICIERKGIATFTFRVKGIEAHSSKCATSGANAIHEAAYKILELEKIKDNDGLTCCCSVINGGTVSNTVPGECVFKANVRFATSAQLEWITNFVNELAAKVYVKGCVTEVSRTGFRMAMEICDRNLALVDEMNRIFEENGMDTLKPFRRTGGSDAADITAFGIPCVDSIGVSGGRIHSPEEFGDLDSLTLSAKRLAILSYNL